MGDGNFFADGPKFVPNNKKAIKGAGGDRRHRVGNVMRENMLLVLTVCSVFIGVGVGFLFRQFNPTQRTIDMVGFPGELFMNILKALILPLIASSLVSGLSQLDARQSGRIGMFAMLYYAITMTLAVTTGICLVLIIHPGDPSIKRDYASTMDNSAANVSAVEKLMDLLRNMFPENIVQAAFQQVETEYVERNVSAATIVSAVRHHVDGMDALGMIVFFIALGLATGQLGKEAKPLADLFIALDKVIIAMVGVVMWYSPIGIASLIAGKILEINDLAKTASMLAMYVMTVVIGLLIQLFITLPTILFLGTRKNPYKFMRGMLQAAMTALGTASSAASLPVTFRCLEQINGVNPKYTKFVLPVGAMVNMDGTALYEAVASVFIAQLNGMQMTVGTVLTMAFTATLASIGAASIPSAGLVTMLIVLTAVGLPANDVTLIIAVDWLLDRLRTATNVMGDGMGCGFVEAMVQRHYGSGGDSTDEGSSSEESSSSHGDMEDEEKQRRGLSGTGGGIGDCCWKTIDIHGTGDGSGYGAGEECSNKNDDARRRTTASASNNTLPTVATAMTLLNGQSGGDGENATATKEVMIKSRH